jgi:hypothetical protein
MSNQMIMIIIVLAFLLLGCKCSCSKVEGFAKGIKESDQTIASAVLEILGVAKKNAETATSRQLKNTLTDARRKSKLLSVGSLASEISSALDGIRVAKKHYSYATKAAAGTGSYKGRTENEHRNLAAAQVIKSIDDFEAIKKVIL